MLPVDSRMQRFESEGTENLAWGSNDESTPHRASCDFFAVLIVPNVESSERYESTFVLLVSTIISSKSTSLGKLRVILAY